MDAAKHRVDFTLPLFYFADLCVTCRLKILFFKKRDLLVHNGEVKNQHYMDKQVEKERDRSGIKENIQYRIELDNGKDESDEKSADCKKSYKIFTSQIFSLKNTIY